MRILRYLQGVSKLTEDDKKVIDNLKKIKSFDVIGRGTLTIKDDKDVIDYAEIERISRKIRPYPPS